MAIQDNPIEFLVSILKVKMYDKLLKCLNEKSESDAEELQGIFGMYDRSIWKWSEDEENFIDQNYLQPNRDSVDFLKDLVYWLVECDKIERGDGSLGLEWSIIDNYGEVNGLLMLLVIQEDKIDYLEAILK